MKKRFGLVSVAAVFMMFILSSCSDKITLSFGTGNIGGNYYSYGNAYSQLLNADDENIMVNVRTTAGSAANLRLIQQGFLDIAVAQSDTLLEAYSGQGNFSDIPCIGVRAVAGLYTEECQIIVSEDSDIKTVSDLYGKRVSVGEKESGVTKNAEQILQASGLTFDMIKPEYLSFSDSADALEKGSIDAFFCTAGAPTTAVSELSKDYDIRLISLDENTVNKIIDTYPGYTKCVIPSSVYQGQSEDVVTVGVKAVLVAGSKVTSDTAYKLVNTLFDHKSELRYATCADELDIDFAVEGIAVPFHEGAAKWYESNGKSVDSVSDGKPGAVHNKGQD